MLKGKRYFKKSLSLLICIAMICSVFTGLNITVNAGELEYLTYKITDGEASITDCDTSATEIIIPDTIEECPVTSISASAFYNCKSLASITISEKIVSIGSRAFYNCTALTEINYNAVSCADFSSGNAVFYSVGKNGSGITVNIGTNVEKIPAYIFYRSSSSSSPNIINVNFAENSKCTSIGDYSFANLRNIVRITFPDSITSIGNSAFRGCTSLSSINIPDSITSIGNSTFYNCTSLNSINIPNTVTSIGNSAFRGCTSLSSINIPDSITSIGSSAFYGCTSLSSITIPKNVTSIGEGAFDNCENLIITASCDSFAVTYATTNSLSIKKIHGETVKDLAVEPNCTEAGLTEGSHCSVCGEVFISQDTVAARHDYDGNYCSRCSAYVFTYVLENDEVTITCCDTAAVSVIVPSEIEGYPVTKIGDSTFSECESLTSVILLDSIKEIGYNAFSDCRLLESITIPESVTIINDRAFEFCLSLSKINYNAKSCIVSEYGEIFYAAGVLNGEITVNIGSNVEEIPSHLFGSAYNIKNVYFEDNAKCKSIGDSAFDRCKALTQITLPNNMTTIGESAFYGCEALAQITIPDSVMTIGDYAFSGCTSLSSITIPENVVDIGDGVFLYCPCLKNIIVEDSNAYFSSSDGVLFNKDKTALLCYPAGKTETSYDIPGSVTDIDVLAFGNCTSLTSMVIPDNVININSQAFLYCTSLLSVTIGRNVKYMVTAFMNCFNLVEINYNATSLLWIDDMNFYQSGAMGDGITVTIGPNVEEIPCYLFKPYEYIIEPRIKEIVFSEDSQCRSIGECAFASSMDFYITAECDSYAVIYALENYIPLNIIHGESIVDAAVVPTVSDYGLTEGSHCSVCNDVLVAQEIIRPLGYKIVLNDTKVIAGYDDTLVFEVDGDNHTYQWYATNNSDLSDSLAIVDAVDSYFSPTDYFFNGSESDFKYYYCVANTEINEVIIPITSPMCINAFALIDETDYSVIDYEDMTICSDSLNNINSYNDIVSIELVDGLSVSLTPSYSYGDLKSYGTGTTVTLKGSSDGQTTLSIVIYGDVNGDGVVDVLDSAEVAKVSTGKSYFSGIYNTAADVNVDGNVNVQDYQATINKALI